MNTICPELLAAKLQSIRNLEDPEAAEKLESCPRVLEALWFIQHASHQPGGLDKLSERLREKFPAAFATKAMIEAGEAKGGRWNLKQCLPVWRSVFGNGQRWGHEFTGWRETMSFKEPLASEDVEHGLESFNYEYFSARCMTAAKDGLPRTLGELCEPGQAVRAPWYCPNLFSVLFDYMDQHAAELERALAPTKVKQIVFRELEFSISEQVPVQIVGNSRFGKTKSVSVKCAMHPGLARLVTVPPESRQRDFLNSVAEALHYTPRRSITHGELDRIIKFIVRHSGLFFIFDESQWLIPSSYTQHTKPARLNWIRSHVIDPPGAPGCAFFSTRQSYKQDLDQFVSKTKFVMEQWLGRMAPIVTLPEDLGREDLLAVAKVNFPEIPIPFLKLISARAKQSEGLLHHIEITAKRARFVAREAGRTEPILEDIQAAIQDMMPAVEQRPTTEGKTTSMEGPEDSSESPQPGASRLGADTLPPLSRPTADAQRGLGGNRLSAPTPPTLVIG